MKNIGLNKCSLTVLLILIFGLTLTSNSQDPKVEKKKRKQNPANVVDTTTYTVSRDTLYFQQKMRGDELDSMILEKQKRLNEKK